MKSFENPAKTKDDLNFYCEACGDRPGGCSQCGFGRQTDLKIEEDGMRTATQEEIDQFFQDMKDFLDNSK